MKSRRSESCPRLPRKGTYAPEASQLEAPLAKGCTLQDLGPEDKQKVAKLLQQVVGLGQEVQQLQLQREEDAQAYAAKEHNLQENNRQLHKENQTLKKKLGQVLLVLRASQAKVNAMESAQQAARDAQRSVEVQTEETAAVPSTSLPAAPPAVLPAPPAPPAPPLAPATVAQPARTDPAPPPGAASPSSPPSSSLGADGLANGLTGSRQLLASVQGAPHVLHVPHGAHINITINHNSEHSGGQTAVTAKATVPSNAGRHRIWQSAAASDEVTSASSLNSSNVPSFPCDGNGHAASSSGRHAPPVVAIPTTAAAAAAAATCTRSETAMASGSSITFDATRPELLAACSSPKAPGSATGYHQGSSAAAGWSSARPSRGTEPGLAAVTNAEAAPAIAVRAVAGCAGHRAGAPRSILVDARMQEYDAVPVHEVRDNSQEGQPASPMIVPPSDEVVAAASSLLGWQAQHGFVARAEAAGGLSPSSSAAIGTGADAAVVQRPGRKVLNYDPAIGKNGAFYFVDVADTAPPPSASGADGSGMPAALGGTPRGQRAPAPAPEPAPFRAQAPCVAQAPQVNRPPGAASAPVGQSSVSLGSLQGWQGSGPAHVHRHVQNSQGVLRQPQDQHVTPQPPPGYPPPFSPCSSSTTDSSVAPTHAHQANAMAAALAYNPNATPNSTLSHMANVLDEVARQQRWDLQPPPGVLSSQACGPLQSSASTSKHGPGRVGGAPAGAWVSGVEPPVPGSSGRTNMQHSAGMQCGRPTMQHSLGSGGSARTPGHGVAPCYANPAIGTGNTDVVNRYDESLVDILSQADQEMEEQAGIAQGQYVPQRQGPQPACSSSVFAPASTRHRSVDVPTVSAEGGSWRTKQKMATMEALLAANLYEENDVFSVILEQESHA